MPVVPFVAKPNGTNAIPKVDPTMLMMAAAELHEAGRLIEPEYRDGKQPSPLIEASIDG